jgi:glycosyltransferase involved in cell wall biosynthesis
MKICHLSTSDSGGGAARAAYRLHTGLRRLGHESTMLVAEKKSFDPTVTKVASPKHLSIRIRRSLRRKKTRAEHEAYSNRPAGQELFSDDRTEYLDQPARQLPACDVVNLHWTAGLVDYEQFFPNLPPSLPVVWRLADMNPLTGGCHYDSRCGRFTERCGACPQLGSREENDLSRAIWTRKRMALDTVRDRLHLVGTSQWIASEARRSSLLHDVPATVIPNGLDTNDFAPRDKRFCRELLGIPQNAQVVLFAADSTDNVRKGFRLVAEALAGITDNSRLMLLSLGAGRPEISPNVRHLHLGKIANDRLLSAVYSAADVYTIASLQESFGQTVIESLACATPVAGFANGGIVDMVRPGITGTLAPTGDVAALRRSIVEVLSLSPEQHAEMSANCRRIANEEYSLDVQARAYVRLYESLILENARSHDDVHTPLTGTPGEAILRGSRNAVPEACAR